MIERVTMAAERVGAAGPLRVTAPAKLNLYLEIVGRRPDGYHLLDSLVAFAGVGDEVSVKPDTTIGLSLAGPFAPALGAGGDNIVLRAARALGEHAGTDAGAAITLTKRLPVASGLGGGSADAAATLVALARLWRLPPADPALEALALRLGADVPVCLLGRAALVRGIGETLTPAPPLGAAHVVLVSPDARLATPEVYAAFDTMSAAADIAPLGAQGAAASRATGDAAGLASFLAERRNDLEGAAQKLAPEIAETLALLRNRTGSLLARMTGSGPTCFAIFADAAAAAETAVSISAERPAWWVAAAPLLSAVEHG